MREDYILLDDELEIVVCPHFPKDTPYLTYAEVEHYEKTVNPTFMRFLFDYNELMHKLNSVLS
jgi:hypothetical protein